MTDSRGQALADRHPDAVDILVSAASGVVVFVGTLIQRGTDQDAVVAAASLGIGVGAVVLWSLRRRRDRVGREAAALLEQRLSIARELHDVVAHHVSLIGIEAAAARRTLDRSPAETATALSAIEASSRAAVLEMQRLGSTLRQPDGTDGGPAGPGTAARPPAPPAPTLADLAELCRRMAEAGLVVDASGIDDAASRALAASTQLALYRIAQEALTNALRHGGGAPVALSLRALGGEVILTVENGPASLPSARGATAGGGMGIPGMRERALAVGGSVDAGPTPAGGFAVVARVPLDQAVGRP